MRQELGLPRIFMAVQILIFLAAVTIHFGLTLSGYLHVAAGTAESSIAAVLLIGFALTWTWWAWMAAIAAQAFGILGTLVGVTTIAIGVGPRTGLDLSLHGVMLIALVTGLVVTLRSSRRKSPVSSD